MEFSNLQSEITFSKNLAEKRIRKLSMLFGTKIVDRIIGLALYLLGGNRKQISRAFNLPVGTFFSFLTRFHNFGPDAFLDNREKRMQPTINNAGTTKIKDADTQSQSLEIVFGDRRKSIAISRGKKKLVVNSSNTLQFKTLILTFFNSGFLNVKETVEQLGIGERRVGDLGRALRRNDVESLIDNRRGQQTDYVFTDVVKAEIIQQFAVNSVAGKSTAGRTIAEQVNQVRGSSLSERAVRLHMSKLGLNGIKRSLPELLKGIKKNSGI